MHKKKVIVVGKLPPPYIGPAIATNIILNSSLNEYFELIHLDTTINRTISDFGKRGNSKIVKNLAVYRKLIQLIRKNKVDLIHIPISQTTIGFLKDSVFILIAGLFRIKIVLQLRGSNFKNWIKTTNIFTKAYVRFCIQKSSGIIVLGNNLRHLFEDYFSRDKIFVVPNGCDIIIPPNTNDSTKSVVSILYFSNLLESKGIKEVLEAMRILKQKGINSFCLQAVGAWYDFDFKDVCLSFVEENDLPVTFHQPKSGDEKWNAFAEADVFVFTPNEPEGHPWAIIEALAASLPIVSTNQGAIVESVIDSENGYIVKNKSAEQIAKSLEKLIYEEPLRKKMGEKSYLHYQQNFTENNMVENLTKTYNKILNLAD